MSELSYKNFNSRECMILGSVYDLINRLNSIQMEYIEICKERGRDIDDLRPYLDNVEDAIFSAKIELEEGYQGLIK